MVDLANLHDAHDMRQRLGGVSLIWLASPSSRGADLARQVGADGFVPYPFDEDSLLVATNRFREPNAQPFGFVMIDRRERRSALRPRAGDIKPCPRCGYAMRFIEWDTSIPMWLCRNDDCRCEVLVRVG
jgi:hypothetical protein